MAILKELFGERIELDDAGSHIDTLLDAGVSESIDRLFAPDPVTQWLIEHGFTGTDKHNHKWVDGKQVAGGKGGTSDAAAKKQRADAEATSHIAGEVEKAFPEEAGKSGVLDKVKGLAAKVSEKAHDFILAHAGVFSRLAQVASAVDALITTPEDLARQPWLAGKFSANTTEYGDAMQSATGIPGHIGGRLVAVAMVRAWQTVKGALGGAKAEGDALNAAAEFLAGLVDATHAALGLEAGADRAAILEALKGLAS